MTVTKDDFNKIWASTSPLTSYSFSESQYKEGWNFIGSTPPSRQMWDYLQKNNDEKMQYLLNHFDNYLPLSGGTLTGVVNGVTPTAGDNSTKIATTEFVNAKAGNYLPLSGGSITGDVDITGDLSVGRNLALIGDYVEPGKVFSIGTTDPGNVDLGWSWVNREGAVLGLRSADHLKHGEFSLIARDSANSCSLDGKPDGSLTWGSKEVERVNASGSNYVRFDSGLQITWGRTQDINASGTYTITFPVAFKDKNYRITTGRSWVTNANENYTFTDVTTTSIKLVTSGTISENLHSYHYIAVGWWK